MAEQGDKTVREPVVSNGGAAAQRSPQAVRHQGYRQDRISPPGKMYRGGNRDLL